MTLVAVVLAAGAALLHVYIWILESFRWTEPATRRTFGVSEADARVMESMAFNQGFYNLFLALTTIVGLALIGSQEAVGTALAGDVATGDDEAVLVAQHLVGQQPHSGAAPRRRKSPRASTRSCSPVVTSSRCSHARWLTSSGPPSTTRVEPRTVIRGFHSISSMR